MLIDPYTIRKRTSIIEDKKNINSNLTKKEKKSKWKAPEKSWFSLFSFLTRQKSLLIVGQCNQKC